MQDPKQTPIKEAEDIAEDVAKGEPVTNPKPDVDG